MLERIVRSRRKLILAFHILIIGVAYILAFELRFDFQVPPATARVLWRTLPLVLVFKLATFRFFRLDRGWWRYTGMHDLFEILKANGAGTVGAIWVVFHVFRLEGLPRSIPILDFAICTGFLAGARIGVRKGLELLDARKRLVRGGKRVLVVGAGDHGVRLAEEIQHDLTGMMQVVGFVDDAPSKLDATFRGIRVLGNSDTIPALVAAHDIAEVVIAIPSATPDVIRGIVARCEKAGVRLRTLPTFRDLAEGRVLFSQVREVRDTDLLGREPRLDRTDEIRGAIRDRRILVTGAAGSIGSEISRQVAVQGPAELVLLDHAETPLFHLERELREKHGALRLRALTGSILDLDWLRAELASAPPGVVFHCAAYKHVPMMEENPRAALRNNVLGTHGLARLCGEIGVERFVNISTDKAARPSTIMGLSKKLAERVVQDLDGNGGFTRFMSVRFGNVMDSQGSVVPILRDQIEKREPITLTNPDATRYFMTIPEAAHLVLRAAAMGSGGEIFLLDMGDPVTIGSLAENLIRLSGFEPHTDILIHEVGLRKGEKLHEELFCRESESPRMLDEGRIMVIERNGRLPISVETITALLEERLERLKSRRDRDPARPDGDRLQCLLAELIPEIARCRLEKDL